MTTAALYRRVSTPRQGEADRFSLTDQAADAAAYCARLGMEVVAEFQDVESGTHSTREEFVRMLAAAAKGEFEVIVVREFSRFARDKWTAMSRLGDLMVLGVEVHEYGESNVIRAEDDSSFFMSSFKAYSADKAASETRRNTKVGQQSALRSGKYMGNAPYGYRKQDGAISVYEPHAAIVRQMFEWYVTDNLSIDQIMERLNAQHVPAPRSPRWWSKTVIGVLKNEKYVGITRWGEGVHASAIPTLIDRTKFDYAQERMRRKKALPKGHTQRSDWWLSGLIRCGHCNGPMSGMRNTSPRVKGDRRRYICTWHKLKRGCGYPNTHKAEDIEREVCETLHDLYGNMRTVKVSIGKAVAEIEAQLDQVERDRIKAEKARDDAIDRLLSAGVGDIVNVESRAQRALESLDERRRSLALEVSDARARASRIQAIPQGKDFYDSLSKVPPQQAKAVLQHLLTCVVAYADQRPVEVIT